MITLSLDTEVNASVLASISSILNDKIDLFVRLLLPDIGMLYSGKNWLTLTHEPVNTGSLKVLNLKIQSEHPFYTDSETEIVVRTIFGNEATLPLSHALNVVLLFALGATNEDLYESEKHEANEACCEMYYELKDYLYTLPSKKLIHRLID